MRILVLDDNADAAKVIESFLKVLDHKVMTCTEGQEALLWLADFKPQLIVTDLDMPGMDGYAFLKQVHARAAFASVPVICITGTDATAEQMSSHGFAAVLRKPTTLSEVMAAVEDVTAALKSEA